MRLSHYISLYPSTAAIASGVLAEIVTFSPPQTLFTKIVWLFVFIFLALTALLATAKHQKEIIKKEDEDIKHQKKRDEDLDIITKQLKILIQVAIPQSTPKQIDQAEKALLQRKTRIESLTPNYLNPSMNAAEKVPLKERALILSEELSLFFALKTRSQVNLSRGDTLINDIDRVIHDYTKTIDTYLETFNLRVLEIYDEIMQNGKNDSDLNNFLENPPNLVTIKFIADHIKNLAEKL